tara:strand:+ start:284 stop:502 length:219 start_codon:yes stop_codon:yes gene_type:complete
MSKPKKILDEGEVLETSIEVMVDEVEEPKFPYTIQLKSTCETITVISEGEDAQGRKTLLTDNGCTYHAEVTE